MVGLLHSSASGAPRLQIPQVHSGTQVNSQLMRSFMIGTLLVATVWANEEPTSRCEAWGYESENELECYGSIREMVDDPSHACWAELSEKETCCGYCGPWTASADGTEWVDTCRNLDIIRVTPGCGYEIEAHGQRYTYDRDKNFCYEGGIGCDAIRRIRVFATSSEPDSYGLVFNSIPLSWSAAEAHCNSLGGNLVTVRSKAMAQHIDATYVRACGSCHPTWIGLGDRADEGSWVWANEDAVDYTNWWGSEPNNMGGNTGEDCASLGVDCIYGYDGVDDTWADSGCEPGHYGYHARASVCQVSCDSGACPESGKKLACPEGLTYHSAPKSWSAARDDCRSREGDLASIHNAAENAEAFALHVERSLPSGQSTWLGLTDAADEGHWVWSDGTPVDYTPSAGEGFRTDNHGGDEDCAGFWDGRGASNSMWDDMYGTESCSQPLPYICKGAQPEGLEVGAVAGIVAGAAVVIILLVVRIILFYKKKPAASPTAVPVMQGVAMPEATPAPTTVMPVATPVQATYA